MNTYVFLIRTLTNLHAGSGDSGGFGVVDKSVQRDATTQLPTIHASSIKGALREHFKEVDKLANDEITRIFGSDQSDRENNKQRGEYRFFSADLVALPQPDHQQYFVPVVETANTQKLENKLTLLNAGNLKINIPGSVNGDLSALANELPVIARNFLDNGVSKNLWYEEVVQRESYFVTFFQGPDDVLAKALNGKVVQLGGNATVGYGFCLFTQL